MNKICYVLTCLIFNGFSSGFYLVGAEMPLVQATYLDEEIEELEDIPWLHQQIEELECKLAETYEAYEKSTKNSQERKNIKKHMSALSESYVLLLFSAIDHADIEGVEQILINFKSLEMAYNAVTDELLFTGIGLLEYALACFINRSVALRRPGGGMPEQEVNNWERLRQIICLLRDRLRNENVPLELSWNIFERAIESGSLTLVKLLLDTNLFSIDKSCVHLLECAIRAALRDFVRNKHGIIEEGRLDIIKFLVDELVKKAGTQKKHLLSNSTVLHEAISAGADQVAVLVLECGAPLLGLLVEGELPIAIAGRVGWQRFPNFFRASAIFLNDPALLEQFPIREYHLSTAPVVASALPARRKKKTVRWEEDKNNPGKVLVKVLGPSNTQDGPIAAQAQNEQARNEPPVAQEEEPVTPRDRELDMTSNNSTAQNDATNVRLSVSIEVPQFNLALSEL